MVKTFEIGKLVATRAVSDRMDSDEKFDTFCQVCMHRYFNADWGDLDEEDRALNDEAIESGDRIFASYIYEDGEKLWIITEADRSVTTLLFPSDY